MNVTSDDKFASALKSAMEAGEIKIYYQPQMSRDGACMLAVESLVRWEHPDHGIMGPIAFVPHAERIPGLIDELGLYVLRQSCRDGKRWPGIGIAVNVSPIQFCKDDFVEKVEAIVREEGFPFERLELEIVETAWFEDAEAARKAMEALRALGIKIALDDFGTGYSSLSALLELPLDKIKIDRSFIARCGEIQSAAIVHAVIALARAIGLKVTAEGIETPEQHQFVRAAGCHFLQGYLFSEPVPAEGIDAFLEKQTFAPMRRA